MDKKERRSTDVRESDLLRDYRIDQLEKRDEQKEVRLTVLERFQAAVENRINGHVEADTPAVNDQMWVKIVIGILTVLTAILAILQQRGGS